MVNFIAALQHSMMCAGFCATEHLCGKYAELVQVSVTVIGTHVISLALQPDLQEPTYVKLHHSCCLFSRASTCLCKLM